MKTDLSLVITFVLVKVALCDIETLNIPRPKFNGEWRDLGNTFDFEAVINKIKEIDEVANVKSSVTVERKQDVHSTNICRCPVCPKIEDKLLKIGKDVQTTNTYQRPECPKIEDKVPEIVKHDPTYCKVFEAMLDIIAQKSVPYKFEKFITFKVTFLNEEYDELKDFVSNTCSQDDKTTLNLLRVISTIEVVPKYEIPGFLKTAFKFFSQNNTLLSILAFAGFCFLLLMWMWYFSRSWYQVCIRSSIFIFITSCLWTWMKMYQLKLGEKESKRLIYESEVPPECFPNEMTFLKSLTTWFTDSFTIRDDPCVKYHQHFIVDPMWEVNPLVAVSETISRMLLHPMSLMGEYIGTFFRNLFKELPFYLWLPITLIVVGYVLIYTILRFKYRIKLPLFLGCIEPVDFNSRNSLEAQNQAAIPCIANTIPATEITPIISSPTHSSPIPRAALPENSAGEIIFQEKTPENTIKNSATNHSIDDKCTRRIDDEEVVGLLYQKFPRERNNADKNKDINGADVITNRTMLKDFDNSGIGIIHQTETNDNEHEE